MRTEKEYANYKLTLEWRFTKPGNTGILVHMDGKDKVWPRSIECQGMHDHQGDFYVIDGTDFNEHTNKASRRVGSKLPSQEKPLGEWNTYEVICKGDTVVPMVNGREVNRATGCSVTQGKICIQSEGASWECRRITIEPAPK
jgi:beta-glucanase (GH16 family)